MKSNTKQTVTIIIAILFLTVLSVTSAQIVNPKTYYSVNNDYSLKVDPSEKYGVGSADYEFKFQNKLIWKKTLSDTFTDVKISENGSLFAFSYILGFKTMYTQENNPLSLWMISKDGHVIFKKDFLRLQLGFHDLPKPLGNGIVLQEQTHSVVFRLTESKKFNISERWLIFDSKTGDKKKELLIDLSNGKEDGSGEIKDVIALDEKGFLIFQEYKQNTSKVSSHYYIVNIQGQILWHQSNSDDLNELDDLLDYYVINHKLMGYSSEKSNFWLLHFKDSTKLIYHIDKNNKITNVSNEKITLKTLEKQQPLSFKQLAKIKQLNSIDLQADENKSNLPSRINFFSFDDYNSFATIRTEQNKTFFNLIDTNNKLVSKFELKINSLAKLNSYQVSSFENIGDSKWLVLFSSFGKASYLFEIDSINKSIRQLDYAIGESKQMVIDNEFGLSFISTKDDVNGLRHFDKNGQLLWEIFEPNYDSNGYLLSSGDLAINNQGDLLVLDNSSSSISFFSLKGKFIKKIMLQKGNNEILSYPTELSILNNKIYVADVKDSQLIIHQYTMDGKWIKKNKLIKNNEQNFSYINDLKTRNKHLWISDDNLYEIGDSLIVLNKYGQNQKQKLFNNIQWIQTNSVGDILLFNEKSYSVISVSDKTNKHKIFSLKSDMINNDISNAHIFIDAKDNVYLPITRSSYAVFSKDGIFSHRINLDNDCEKYCTDIFSAHRTKPFFLQIQSGEIRLIKSQKDKSSVIKLINKDVANKWLGMIRKISTTANGRLIVLADNNYPNTKHSKNSFHVISAEGNLTHSFKLLNKKSYIETFSLAGKYVYLKYVDEELIRVLDLKGQQVSEIKLIPNTSHCSNTLLYADSITQKLYVYQNKQILIYQLPE